MMVQWFQKLWESTVEVIHGPACQWDAGFSTCEDYFTQKNPRTSFISETFVIMPSRQILN
jgi:hypothetical protein